jgi:hypothetical protein
MYFEIEKIILSIPKNAGQSGRNKTGMRRRVGFVEAARF